MPHRRKPPNGIGSTDQRVRILVVEDNPVNRRVMEITLNRLGYSADQARDGVEAVQMVAEKPYDLILMDLQMPRMDGIEATQIILEQSSSPPPTIVAVTANCTSEAREASDRVGMSAFLTKPLKPDLLLVELRKAESERGPEGMGAAA